MEKVQFMPEGEKRPVDFFVLEETKLGGKQYLLDQHIKHGIKSEELIRIYFCCSDRISGRIYRSRRYTGCVSAGSYAPCAH